ncbi:MAG: tetratricopeptide repeat protein [Planctomycetota bacterium]|jgi:tetratricopeptide (TPR) repeat protein
MHTQKTRIPLICLPCIFICCFCLAPLWAGEPAAPEEDINAGAWKAFHQGKYDEALADFKDGLADDPDDAVAMEGLLETEHITGKYKSAVKRAVKWLEGKEKADRVWTVLGEIRVTVGVYDGAVEAFRKATEINKNNYRAQVGLAEVLDYVGKKSEAEKITDELFDLMVEAAEPGKFNAEDYISFARGCILVGDSDLIKRASDELFEKARRQAPENGTLFSQWGYLFLDKYNYPDAKVTFEEYMTVNKNHPDVNYGMALVTLQRRHLGQKKIPEAMKFIDKALAVNPNHVDCYILLAYLAIVDSLHNEAREHLKTAAETNPNRLDMLALLASSHWLRGERAQHDLLVKRAREINPHPAEFYNTVASVIEGKFRYREAYEYAKKAIEEDDEYWDAYYTAGANALRIGLSDEARNLLENAYEIDPYNVRCFNALQLMDYMGREYETIKSEHFVLRIKEKEVPFLKHIAEKELNSYLKELAAKYKMTPRYPITIEFFAKHQDFSARTVGLPGIGASGACFGEVVTQISPNAMPPMMASWMKTLRHEFAHVITLQKTKNRISRWFTEGLSVYEESQGRPSWRRPAEYMFLSALFGDKLLPLRKLDSGFTKPKWRQQVLLCYYHGGVIVDFIIEKYGFEKINELLDAYGKGLVIEKSTELVFGQTPEEFDADFMAYARKRFGQYRVEPHIWPDTIKRLKLKLEKEKTAKNYARLARAYIRSGNRSDAEINIGRALKLDKDCPDARLVQGIRFQDVGKIERAKKEFRKAIAFNVHDLFTAYFNLGVIAEKEEELEEAAAEYRAAIDAFPKACRRGAPANPYERLAVIYKKLEDDKKYIDILEKWCALDFNRLGERKILAKHYSENKLYEKLEIVLEDLAFLYPFDNSIAPMRLEMYYAQGRFKEGADLSDRMDAQKIYKLSPDQLFIRAACYSEAGRKGKAIESLQDAIRKDRKHEQSIKLLKELGGEMPKEDEKPKEEKKPEKEPEEETERPDYEKPDYEPEPEPEEDGDLK